MTSPPGTTAAPYHRVARLTSRTGRWWRPLVVMVLAAALWAVAAVLLISGFVGKALIQGDESGIDQLGQDPSSPTDIAFLLGVLACALPAVALAFRWAGSRRGAMAGTLHSVAGRFRWRLLADASRVVVPVFVLLNAGMVVIVAPQDLVVPTLDASLVAMLGMALVLTPLQSAAEEYLSRALPQQILGTWLRSPIWGILLPVPLFVAGHEYDVWGSVDMAVFALAMGFLTWKTGGIELPILVHAANNLPLMLLTPLTPNAVEQGQTHPWELLTSLLLIIGVTGGLTWWVSRRDGVALLEPVRGYGRTAGPTTGRADPQQSTAPRPVQTQPTSRESRTVANRPNTRASVAQARRSSRARYLLLTDPFDVGK